MNQLVWIAGIVLGLAFPAYGAETRAKAESRTEAESLMQDFASSAKLSGVPLRLLSGMAYLETGLVAQPRDAESEGNPLMGVMGLRLEGTLPSSVQNLANRTGVHQALLISSQSENIRAAALGLRRLLDGETGGVASVKGAALFLGLPAGASNRYQIRLGKVLQEGIATQLRDGSRFVLPPAPDAALQKYLATLTSRIPQAPGYGPADYVPACSGNYTNASRGANEIQRIIIHTVQGSYSSCINWFANCDAQVSAHCVVSKNGK